MTTAWVGQRAHAAPFGAVAPGGSTCGPASEAVGEDGDGADVGLFAQRRSTSVDGLRRSLDAAGVIARAPLSDRGGLCGAGGGGDAGAWLDVWGRKRDDGVGWAREGFRAGFDGLRGCRERSGGGKGKGMASLEALWDPLRSRLPVLMNDGGAGVFVAALHSFVLGRNRVSDEKVYPTYV